MYAFWKDEAGATAIEYGLIISLIAVVIIGSLTVIGETISARFNSIKVAVSAAGA